MNKRNLFTFAVGLTVFVFSTQVAAGPCDQGITLVNPLTGMVEINGVDVGDGTIVDTTFEIRSDGVLVLQDLKTGNQAMPGNRYNVATSQVELDCVVFKENTYHVNLDLVQEADNTLLQINRLGELFDASLTTNWTVDYSNDFADDPLVLNADGTTTLSTFSGSYQLTSAQQISIDLGLSGLTGTVDIGQISGNFNHFGESGTFVATPSERTQTKLLNNGRFQVEVDWNNGTSSGKGDAISVTNDSAAFFFFDSSDVEILVRVLDGCAFNNHYWVFASAATNVEYTLTVTDTSTGTNKAFDLPLAGTAISDTSAFSTCP